MKDKYEVYERPRPKHRGGKKRIPKMKPDDDYPPKYKVYKRSRPSASRKKCC